MISRNLALIAIVFAFLAGTSYAADKEETFYLFNAEYNSSMVQKSQTTVFLEKRLFKINRQTGETWVLVDVLKNGKDIKYWQKITAREVEGTP